ncbi:adenosine deaminase [Clostridium chromiireducens]|uniref:Adenosine deaminase n=2 Tax=Clostridium chromiireducens TaxID=225345 RepID=A0A964RNL0_9CLOT|nr:adenosine deaminase [Clostridium chromiireducens]MVX64962.1 adenosine deaminase [Clostridium chromiireducens]
MKDRFSNEFIDALEKEDIKALRGIPKADLHNHFALGGNREYIREVTEIEIPYYKGILKSMDDMHKWNSIYLGERFNNREMRKLQIDATFVQANLDGIKILEIGEDVWGLGEFFNNDIEELINTFSESNKRFAPETELRLQIGLSRHCSIEYLLDCLENFWGRKEFYSIDLYGDELAQPIENFEPIYIKAKDNGLRLKAHIGEWGNADDIKKGVEILGLDEIQHGISAVESGKVIQYLIDNKIRLNLTPTSNEKLGRVRSICEHPIKELYRAGVDVTINSDDILIFDSDVSKEYLRLYKNHVLLAEELDSIRVNGLSSR